MLLAPKSSQSCRGAAVGQQVSSKSVSQNSSAVALKQSNHMANQKQDKSDTEQRDQHNTQQHQPPPYTLLPSDHQPSFAPQGSNESTDSLLPEYDHSSSGTGVSFPTDVKQGFAGKSGDGPLGEDGLPLPGVRHYITSSDTLVGLSFKYGADIQNIRRANKLFTDDVIARQYLFIPYATVSHQPRPSLDDIHKTLVKRFQIITKCVDTAEAWSYLRQNEFGLEAALEQYWEDLKWEREYKSQNGQQGGPSSFSVGKGKWKKVG
ncbi:hypothetical protein DFS34DRAFT_606852 [Phlyctochytrium arcticum]|nr:hypothetical protein DFS34DRAFT_606852 [Phlyctochytrium arcticum]